VRSSTLELYSVTILTSMEIHNKSILDPRMQLWNLLKTFWRMLNEKSRTFYLEDGFLESMIAHIEEKFLERCGIQFSSLKILKNKDPYLLDTFSKLEFILDLPICEQSYFQGLFEQFWIKIRNAVCAYDKRFQVRITDSRGFSVFALENIPKRTLIGVYHGSTLLEIFHYFMTLFTFWTIFLKATMCLLFVWTRHYPLSLEMMRT